MIKIIKTLINTPRDSKFDDFIKIIGNRLMDSLTLEEKLNNDYFKSMSFEELLVENKQHYAELVSGYERSYANPDFAVECFGKDMGKLLSAVYTDFRQLILYSYEHDRESLKACADFYVRLTTLLDEDANQEEIILAYSEYKSQQLKRMSAYRIHRQANPNKSFENKMLTEDLSDLRYLFKYGRYITDNEVRTAQFLASYDDNDLKDLMKITAQAYVNGFKTDGKDISLRNNVHIVYNIGQEKMVFELIKAFESYGLQGFFGTAETTAANKQYGYDHRFDKAIYLEPDFAEQAYQDYAHALEELKEFPLDYSGIMVIERFGEKPFEPVNKDNAWAYNDDQIKLSQDYQNKYRTLADKYYKGEETSFCIIAFPVPEIGDNFEEIFADTCEINRLSSEEYLPIQTEIIKALDRSAYVHVKGVPGNKTDIIVQHAPLEDPAKESNYFNCGADVNIPVGEVFTSPQLKGTKGLLHLDVVYLDELKYIDLELVFEDGYVTNYSCKNFESEEENKKYIEENLLFPHKTLPLGEFAIGTNTLAYVIAEKHNITDILPILIVEKMGPHFAIGDTCYSFAEDLDVYNPDGKCVVARDNERSILRKDDLAKAYTNVHTDITLPYDSLAFINGITEDGQTIEIIKNGRFVLKGTEKLNEAFE